MTSKKIAEKACNEWFAYQDRLELEFALKIVKKFAPKVILEIGVANGASLAAWAAATNPDLAIGIDPLTNPKTLEQKKSFYNLIGRYHLEIIPYLSSQKEAKESLEKILKQRPVEFLFIDAEHKYDDVRRDYYEYLKYMATPSLIGFHDIYYDDKIFDSGSQVSALWNRLKSKYKYDEIHFHSTMGIGFIYYE